MPAPVSPPDAFTLLAGDGYPLGATRYAGDPARVLVVNPAVGVRQPFYAPFARYLAGRGFTVFTYDYRGVGASRPARLRGFDAAMHDWGERDMAAVFAHARAAYPDARVGAVGHSAGGQLLGLTPHAGAVEALWTVSSQSGYVGHWPWPQRLLLEAVWRLLVPLSTRVLGYYPWRFLGGPLPGPMVREWARWALDRDYLLGAHARPSTRHFAAFRGAWCAVSIADDQVAPCAAVDALTTFYPNARVTRRHLAPGEGASLGHFGFFREGVGDRYWPETAAWLASALDDAVERPAG